jgi:predicted metal-binding membrane protein
VSDAIVEVVLRRDHLIIMAALIALTALAWADLWWLANDMAMGGMDMTGFRMVPAGIGMMMPAPAPWASMEFGFVFTMWAVMMVGMMTPSVAPMILLYARRPAGGDKKRTLRAGDLVPGGLSTRLPRTPRRGIGVGHSGHAIRHPVPRLSKIATRA